MTRSSLSNLSRYALLLAGKSTVILNLTRNTLTVSEIGGTYGAYGMADWNHGLIPGMSQIFFISPKHLYQGSLPGGNKA
jgi:hypothetical protein